MVQSLSASIMMSLGISQPIRIPASNPSVSPVASMTNIRDSRVSAHGTTTRKWDDGRQKIRLTSVVEILTYTGMLSMILSIGLIHGDCSFCFQLPMGVLFFFHRSRMGTTVAKIGPEGIREQPTQSIA